MDVQTRGVAKARRIIFGQGRGGAVSEGDGRDGHTLVLYTISLSKALIMQLKMPSMGVSTMINSAPRLKLKLSHLYHKFSGVARWVLFKVRVK